MKLALAEHTFVIAEMANSHEGNLSTAKKIVEKASFAGVDAKKTFSFFDFVKSCSFYKIKETEGFL